MTLFWSLLKNISIEKLQSSSPTFQPLSEYQVEKKSVCENSAVFSLVEKSRTQIKVNLISKRMVKTKRDFCTASLSGLLNGEWSFLRLGGIFFHCGWSRINLKQSSNDYKLQTNFYLACCDKDYWKIGSLTNDELSNMVHTKIIQNYHPDFWALMEFKWLWIHDQ